MLIHDGRAQMSFEPAKIATSIVIPLTLLATRRRRAAFHQGAPWGILPGRYAMPEKQNPTDRHSDGPRTYPGEKARQGEIILRKPWMRVVFIAGLVGCVLLGLGIRIAAGP
jgi:hypothetical protein